MIWTPPQRGIRRSEINQQIVVADYTALIGATGKGKSASPIHYDAKAYRTSEAYQLKDDVHKNAENYIQFKKIRLKPAGLPKSKKSLPRSRKSLQTGHGMKKCLMPAKTFVGEITGYYDYKRASEGVDPITGEKLTYGQRVAAERWAPPDTSRLSGGSGKVLKGSKAHTACTKPKRRSQL